CGCASRCSRTRRARCAPASPPARPGRHWCRRRWRPTSARTGCTGRRRGRERPPPAPGRDGTGGYNRRWPPPARTHLTTHAQVITTQLPNPPTSIEKLLETVHAAVGELKAKDVVEIDVRRKSSVTDFMVIASGTSSRHVKSIADEVVKFAKRLDVMPLGVEGELEAEWVLVDLGD